MSEKKLTKRQQRRLLRKQQRRGEVVQLHTPGVGISIQEIAPLTYNQKAVFDSYYDNKHLMLHGTAGTGKTFLALYLSLSDVLESDVYNKVVICRSTEPVRAEGFLPGSPKQKAEVYESPYKAICSELFGRGDAYDLLKHKGKLDFISTAYIRGITVSDCILVVDEIQNLTSTELHTIITRVGKNCKVIFCGDIRQNDLKKKRNDVSGLGDFLKIIQRMKAFDIVEFQPEDICRHPLVKEYILTRNELEDADQIASLY